MNESKNIGYTYQANLHRILNFGKEVSPRGMLTKEILGAQIRLDDSAQCVLTLPTRKLNYAFSVAEWLWMLFGRNDVRFISVFNSQIGKFSDNGETFAGAYGPMITSQLEYVYNSLKKDKDSRQAISINWRPNPGPSKDIPCTIGYHFLIRDNKLNLITWMRSNDLWLGTPYDIFNFCQIQNFLAGLLGIERGSYIHNADSLHLYEQHFEIARKVVNDNNWIGIKTNAIELPNVGFDTYLYYKSTFHNSLFIEGLLSGQLADDNIDIMFPIGLREHVKLLNNYCKKDKSHLNTEFWEPVYTSIKEQA